MVRADVIEPATCGRKAVVEVTVNCINDGFGAKGEWTLSYQRTMQDCDGNSVPHGPMTIHSAHGYTTRIHFHAGEYLLRVGGGSVFLQVGSTCSDQALYGLTPSYAVEERSPEPKVAPNTYHPAPRRPFVEPGPPSPFGGVNTSTGMKTGVRTEGEEGGGGGGTPTPAYRGRVGSGAITR